MEVVNLYKYVAIFQGDTTSTLKSIGLY